MGNPQLLILDEPTTGLDPNQILEIRSLIKSLVTADNGSDRQTRPIVLLSTHIMQEVKAVCDRVIILDKGVIKADMPIGQIDDLETLFRQCTDNNLN